MSAPSFQDRRQYLLDTSIDPVPPYEEFQFEGSEWQIVDPHRGAPVQDDENLIDVGPREDEPHFRDGDHSPHTQVPTESRPLSENDIVIAVMGVTGAGKSSFISKLTNEAVVVGDGLESCTTDPAIFDYTYKDKLIRLVDTPGFDDTNRKDTDILQDIAFFLSALYARKIRLAGILYLHRITDPKMTGTAVKNLQLLQCLCGDEGVKKVVLVSTMWNLLTEVGSGGSINGLKVGEDRETMLKTKFWHDIIQKGGVSERHYGDRRSGDRILDRLLNGPSEGTRNTIVLDIQRELIDQKLQLPQTAAGQYLQKDLNQTRKRYEKEIQEYQEELEEAKKDKDEKLAKELERQQKEIEEELIICNTKASELQVDFRVMASGGGDNSSNGNDQWQKQQSDDIKFLEQSVAELQDAFERQARDHRAEIARLRNNRLAKTADIEELIRNQNQRYEEETQGLRVKIAREKQARWDKEKELKKYKRNKQGSGFAKLFESFFGFYDQDSEESNLLY